MITVKRLIEELRKFPDDALCEAYEGEDTGILIRKNDNTGFIPAHPCREIEDELETDYGLIKKSKI